MNPAILFFIVVAVITVIALWFVLRPLLAVRDGKASAATNTNVDAIRIELSEARRDQKLGLLSESALVEAERELESRVLAEAQVEPSVAAPRSKRTAIALGVILPVLAIAGYAAVGSPVAVVPEIVRPPQQASAAANNADQQMADLFRMAEERLKAQPNDAMGWALLARAKASVGMFDGAIAAYEKAVALTPNDGDLWADYADAAAGQSQGKMDGKPIELINKAIALDGKNPKALLLRGTYEIQKNDLAAAEKSFTLARSVVEPSSGFAQIADNALADIKNRRGAGTASASPGKGDTSPASGETATASDAVLATVQLQLSADARKAAGPTASVFLIVRSAGVDRGPPLAAKKIALADVEKPVLLTTADAMIGGAGLKAGGEVAIQARLSLNGQPTPQTGDWQSAKTTAKLPVSTVKLSLDQPVQN